MTRENERDKLITQDQAVRSIYLDCEGVGGTPGEPHPVPHLLGCYRPKINGRSAEHHAWLTKPAWKPIANGAGAKASVGELEVVIERLVEEVRERKGFLVYWNDDVRQVVERHCPALYDRFLEIAFDAKPPVDRMYDRNYAAAEESRPDTLAGYMRYYFPKSKETGTIEPGPADSCRRLDIICGKEHRWRKWSNKQKRLASSLLQYSRSECRSTWKLTRRLANPMA